MSHRDHLAQFDVAVAHQRAKLQQATHEFSVQKDGETVALVISPIPPKVEEKPADEEPADGVAGELTESPTPEGLAEALPIVEPAAEGEAKDTEEK
jgi:hypothetical protein